MNKKMTLQSICFPVQSIFYEVYNILKLHPPEFWSDLPPEKSRCPPSYPPPPHPHPPPPSPPSPPSPSPSSIHCT